MGIELHRQALALLLALGLGVLLGLAYDLLRPPRRRSGQLLGAALDLVFCAAAGFAAFLYAMSAGNGRLGLWELAAMLLGFLLYLSLPSRWLLPLFSRGWELFFRGLDAAKKTLKILRNLAKKCFQIVAECFILKK